MKWSILILVSVLFTKIPSGSSFETSSKGCGGYKIRGFPENGGFVNHANQRMIYNHDSLRIHLVFDGGCEYPSGYEWFHNGNPIPNSNSTRLTAYQSGEYYVKMSGISYISMYGPCVFCTKSIQVIILPFSGIEHFSAYPNPVNDRLTLQFFSAMRGNAELLILDSNGRKIFYNEMNINADFFQEQINFKDFPAGLYIVSVKVKDAVVQKKIIKQ